MALQEEFKRTGNYLFRWRSYLPLLLIILILAGLKTAGYSEHNIKWNQLWKMFCLFISFFGLGIRIFTIGYISKGTSGRNVKKQIADTLNTTGIYSIVRHPLYLGNFFIWFGISLFFQLWWMSLIFILIFALYYERIMFAEEEFLRNKFGKSFLQWAELTPAFLPKFKNWKSTNSTFSIKKVLGREYSGFFGIIASFTLLEIIENVFVEAKIRLDFMWIILFTVGLLIYITLRTLKKKTKILNIRGR